MNLLLTGEIRAGKSTVLNKILGRLKGIHSIDGLFTLPIIENNAVKGFYLKSYQGRTETFAHVDFNKTHSFGPFGVDPEVFNTLGADVLRQAPKAALIVIDEIGMMEQGAHLFEEELMNLYRTRKNIFLVVQQRALDYWMTRIGWRHLDLHFTVTPENRDTLPETILKHLNQ